MSNQKDMNTFDAAIHTMKDLRDVMKQLDTEKNPKRIAELRSRQNILKKRMDFFVDLARRMESKRAQIATADYMMRGEAHEIY